MTTPILNLSIIIDLLEIIIHIDIINCCSRHIVFSRTLWTSPFPSPPCQGTRRDRCWRKGTARGPPWKRWLLSFWRCIYIYMWVNYNISLTWNKAILGMIPLTNYDYSEVAVRSQHNLPVYMVGEYPTISCWQSRVGYAWLPVGRTRRGSTLSLPWNLKHGVDINDCSSYILDILDIALVWLPFWTLGEVFFNQQPAVLLKPGLWPVNKKPVTRLDQHWHPLPHIVVIPFLVAG